MPLSSYTHEIDSVAVIRALQHVERLSEAEIAQDIHGQPVAPVGHVLGGAPALLLVRQAAKVPKTLAEGSDVCQDVSLHLLDGAVGECLRQHTALARVHFLVTRVVGVGRRVDEGIVELGLADVGSEAIDLLQRRVGIDRERAGPEAHEFAIFLVHPPELKVPVASPGVVQHVGIGNLGHERAWVLCQRMKEDVVKNNTCYLSKPVRSSLLRPEPTKKKK